MSADVPYQFVTLYGDLLDQELGTADRSDLFTLDRRKYAINEGQREFNRLTECYQRQFAITVTTNTQEYDLFTLITNSDYNWLARQGVEFKRVDANSITTNVGGAQFQRVDIPVLDNTTPSWRGASAGTPTSYYLRDDGMTQYLGLYPPPSVTAGETWTLIVPYVATPPDMSADSDAPFATSYPNTVGRPMLRPFLRALVHFAAAKLELLRKDKQASAAQLQAFTGYVADFFAKQRPKGGQTIQIQRGFRVGRGMGGAPWQSQDPRTWP